MADVNMGGGGAGARDGFSGYHPAVNLLFFVMAIAFSVVFMHPLCLAVSLSCSFIYSISLNGARALRFNLRFLLPLMIAAALLNPAFNHEGATILLYLKSGNPLTLESIAFGGAAAAMLGAVVCWFSCYSAVMSSDKFIYLFGRVIPSLSLVLSMALRMVPRFRAQFRLVAEAQRCVGRDMAAGGPLTRLRRAVTVVSIMVTWALENAIETADSMKCRGYGLPGRTAFSIYRMEARDLAALAFMGGLGLYILAGSLAGGFYWSYFPYMRGAPFGPLGASMLVAYAALCLSPFALDRWEDMQWRRSQ
ncbi:MAG: energy-coupling factor transporter transmembrane protein EcfT [Clostridiales Family XIII bacterium]|jgi:energy-coupling factor transport system permease protein|nr:energy-coupling factor transporter transmembrane protein EcfT [Clostridiales Family XIII bacterium]